MTKSTHPFTAVLERAAKRLQPATIIDVGASNGQWSQLALETWPEARVLLIEANPVWKPEQDVFCQRSGALSTWAVAGANEGHASVEFFKEEPCQGIKLEPTGTVLPVTTIDAELRRTNLPAPYLLKLDVHGHENMILEGARKTLPKTCAVVVEVYFWEPR
jgi:FkbM family methyltransferase